MPVIRKLGITGHGVVFRSAIIAGVFHTTPLEVARSPDFEDIPPLCVHVMADIQKFLFLDGIFSFFRDNRGNFAPIIVISGGFCAELGSMCS